MSELMRWRFLILRAFCAVLLLVIGTGCPPTFNDVECEQQSDCFQDEVCNEVGACVRDLDALPQLAITRFGAEPDEIESGESVTLSWVIEDAQSASIAGGDFSYTIPEEDLAQGSVEVDALTQETVFVLTASQGIDQATKRVVVSIRERVDLPMISVFAPDEPRVIEGERVTLNWETEGGESGEITGGASPYTIPEAELDSGSTTFDVTQETTFTLRVTNSQGSSTSNATITVVPADPPVIESFEADADTIAQGSDVILSWQISGADSVIVSSTAGGNVFESSTRAEAASGSVTVAPAVTTTYTLSAVNSAGATLSDPVTVTVVVLPVIVEFSASETSDIPSGDTITLTWEVTGSTDSLKITAPGIPDIPLVGATGSVDVVVDASRTYTLEASNFAGTVTQTIDVVVFGAPVIQEFRGSQEVDVPIQSSIDLIWNVDGADSIVIRDSDGREITASTMSMGQISVSIGRDETFTLTAMKGGLMATATVMITALRVPTITNFTASKQSDISPNSMITLNWSVSGADTIELDDGSGFVDVTVDNGSRSVTVTQDTTYTLRATNAAGFVEETVSVTLLPVPTIASFAASMTSNVPPNSMITLTWSVSGADTIELDDGSGFVDVTADNGSRSVTVTQDTTYTLRATNAAGFVEETVSVSLTPVVAPTLSVTTTKSMTVSGEVLQIQWTTTDATTLTVTDDQGLTSHSASAGEIASGMLTVRPQVTTIYTITATGPGGTASDMKTVTVDAADLVISEVLYDPVGADTDREWIEIFNAGDTFVDLSNYSIGVAGPTGGMGIYESTYQLSGITIGPKEAIVVGGSISDALNGSPVLAQSFSFTSPILDNADGTSAVGVAIFFEQATAITSSSVPVDAVLWGGTNDRALLGDDGLAILDTQVSSDVAEGGSLVRLSLLSDQLSPSSTPSPNIAASSLIVPVPNRGPSESQDPLLIEGLGLSAALDEVMLGSTMMTCMDAGSDTLSCVATTPLAPGPLDLTITRVNRFVFDSANPDTPMVMPIPIADQRSAVAGAAFFSESRIPDPGVSFYCGALDITPNTVVTGATVTAEVTIFEAFTTSGVSTTIPSTWRVQAAIIDRTVNPFDVFASWIDFDPALVRDDLIRIDHDIVGVELQSSVPRTGEVAFRVSMNDGLDWIYCDADNGQQGSDDGWQVGGGPDVEWTP